MMFFIGFLLLLLFGYLSRIYEHNSYAEIVERQVEHNSIYGTALNNFPMSYFLELIKQRKPKILMVGSSRSGWFKEKYFNVSFVTTPNASDSFPQMEAFLNEALRYNKPDVIMIEFDPWLLLQDPNLETPYCFPQDDEKAINLSKIFIAIKLILKNNMIFDCSLNTNPYTDYDSMGIYAIKLSRGQMMDGSFFHAPTYFGYGNALDKKFQTSLWKIRNGYGAFSWGDKINQKNIFLFQRIVKNLKSKGIKVVPIVMPLPPTIWNETYGKHPNKYVYWKELEDNAKNLGIYDFLNPSSIDTNDCEFVDGVHPGDVVSARVLKKIGKENPAFMKYLNIKEINWAINHRSGHVYSGRDFGKYKEVDFLEIGCKKH